MQALVAFPTLEALWTVWILYWFLSAARVRRAARKESSVSRSSTILISIPAVILLANTGLDFGPLNRRFIPGTDAVHSIGMVVTGIGLIITVWARVHLGQFWSARVSLKEGHELIQSGPYAYVRHPIYSGLLVALIGTALFVGEYRAIVAVLLIFLAHRQKALREERLLSEQFGEAFRHYRERTGSLVPKLF